MLSRVLCKPGNEVVVSKVRSDGQMSNRRDETGDDLPVQGCSPTRLRRDIEKYCPAAGVSPKFSSLGAESCERFEAVAGWAAG